MTSVHIRDKRAEETEKIRKPREDRRGDGSVERSPWGCGGVDSRHDLRGSWCLCIRNEKSLKIFDQKSHMIKSVFHEDAFRHGI